MDIMTPEIGGIEALRIIRLRQANTPVLIITSSMEKATVSLAEGAQAYLLKPIKPERLKEAVDRLLMEKA